MNAAAKERGFTRAEAIELLYNAIVGDSPHEPPWWAVLVAAKHSLIDVRAKPQGSPSLGLRQGLYIPDGWFFKDPCVVSYLEVKATREQHAQEFDRQRDWLLGQPQGTRLLRTWGMPDFRYGLYSSLEHDISGQVLERKWCLLPSPGKFVFRTVFESYIPPTKEEWGAWLASQWLHAERDGKHGARISQFRRLAEQLIYLVSCSDA